MEIFIITFISLPDSHLSTSVFSKGEKLQQGHSRRALRTKKKPRMQTNISFVVLPLQRTQWLSTFEYKYTINQPSLAVLGDEQQW